jgi:myosin heavy subunit
MDSNTLTDLSQLDNLDQAAILEALRSRYARDEIYVSKTFYLLFQYMPR